MMLIASLIELPFVKTPMWQKHNIHLANFDMAGFACYLVSLGPLLGCRHIEMSRAESARCNGLVVWSCVRL
jgi:hypothetical protein